MEVSRNELTAYDASEGALYVLFAAVLCLSGFSPRLFAIDNLDQALNPRLMAKLAGRLAGWFLKPDGTTRESLQTLPVWAELVAPVCERVAKTLAEAPGSKIERLSTPLTRTNYTGARSTVRKRPLPDVWVRALKPELTCRRSGGEVPRRDHLHLRLRGKRRLRIARRSEAALTHLVGVFDVGRFLPGLVVRQRFGKRAAEHRCLSATLVRDPQDDSIDTRKIRASEVRGYRNDEQPRFGSIDERLPNTYLADMPSAAHRRATVALT